MDWDHIHLHIGAHKTATTYLQSTFKLNADRIMASGRECRDHKPITPLNNFLRPQRRVQIARQRSALNQGRIADDKLERTRDVIAAATAAPGQLARALRPGPSSPRQLLYCDENIIGTCEHLIRTGVLYPTERMTLEIILDNLSFANLSASFCVRSYDSFFAAAHAQAALGGGGRPWKDVLGSLIQPARTWPDVVADLLEMLDGHPLTIWRYEDFPVLERQVLGLLIGTPLDDLQRPPRMHVTPSATAMRIADLTIGTLGPTAGLRVLNAARKMFPKRKASHAYDPFRPDERRSLRTRYDQDCRIIAAMPGVTFLQPDTPSLDAGSE